MRVWFKLCSEPVNGLSIATGEKFLHQRRNHVSRDTRETKIRWGEETRGKKTARRQDRTGPQRKGWPGQHSTGKGTGRKWRQWDRGWAGEGAGLGGQSLCQLQADGEFFLLNSAPKTRHYFF